MAFLAPWSSGGLFLDTPDCCIVPSNVSPSSFFCVDEPIVDDGVGTRQVTVLWESPESVLKHLHRPQSDEFVDAPQSPSAQPGPAPLRASAAVAVALAVGRAAAGSHAAGGGGEIFCVLVLKETRGGQVRGGLGDWILTWRGNSEFFSSVSSLLL